MGDSEQTLSATEILMLIEGLDALLPRQVLPGQAPSAAEYERLEPYAQLRERLRQAVGLGYYDQPRRWLDNQLFKEREATLENMLRVVYPALRDPGMTRSKLKDLIGETFRKLKWERQYRPHHVTEWDRQVAEQAARVTPA